MQQHERIILGIDPGTNIMGFGVVLEQGKKPTYRDMGVLDIRKLSDPYLKLQRIFETTLQWIERYHPDELAIEAPFYGKNVQSMLKLGRAQGVAIAAALSRNIPVFEYAPRKIKLAITGIGQASKEQVYAMLATQLSISDMPESLDATDGLAVALCHCYAKTTGQEKTSAKNWEEFIRKNPGRIG